MANFATLHIQVFVKWFNFEEFYKISQLEVGLHILDLSHLEYKYFRKKIGGLIISFHTPTYNYVMSDDAIAYFL